MFRSILCLASVMFMSINCFQHFTNLIPNGNMVSDPCNTSWPWPAVGHEDKNGGGSRNLFGKDFEKNGYEWTPELCRMDSDMDNRTNGEELGDANCTWTLGDIPAVTSKDALSHPGVCEPIDALECATVNLFLPCLDIVVATTPAPGCLSHSDNDNSTSPCEGKRQVKDKHHEMTYCCEGNSTRPIGHRSVTSTSDLEFLCRCVTEEEYCKDFPLFC